MSKARIINFKPTPRPKSNLIPFLSVVLIGALIMSMCNRTATAQGTKTTTDSIPAKKYHYFLTIKRIDFNTWNKSIDTLQGVHSIIGKSLLKDQADLNYELASRQIQRIFEHMSVDSVLIQEPKTKK